MQRGVETPAERLRAALTWRLNERRRFLSRLHLGQIDSM